MKSWSRKKYCLLFWIITIRFCGTEKLNYYYCLCLCVCFLCFMYVFCYRRMNIEFYYLLLVSKLNSHYLLFPLLLFCVQYYIVMVLVILASFYYYCLAVFLFIIKFTSVWFAFSDGLWTLVAVKINYIRGKIIDFQLNNAIIDMPQKWVVIFLVDGLIKHCFIRYYWQYMMIFLCPEVKFTIYD